jgi:hypothetical protein
MIFRLKGGETFEYPLPERDKIRKYIFHCSRKELQPANGNSTNFWNNVLMDFFPIPESYNSNQ